jgi:hypothetical protein
VAKKRYCGNQWLKKAVAQAEFASGPGDGLIKDAGSCRGRRRVRNEAAVKDTSPAEARKDVPNAPDGRTGKRK